MNRASSLPRLAKCPASAATIDDALAMMALPDRISSDPAELGTAYHYLMERWQRGETVSVEDVAALAAESAVDRDDLLWMWGRLSSTTFEVAPQTLIEERMELGEVSGQPDLVRVWPDQERLIVDDWKTGRVVEHARDSQQIRAYAVMAAKLNFESTDDVVAIGRIWSIRSARPTEVVFEGPEIDREWERITRITDKVSDAYMQTLEEREYRVGDHCGYCKAKPICPAYREAARSALQIVTGSNVDISGVKLVKSGPRKGQPNLNDLARLRAAAIEEQIRDMLVENIEEAWMARSMMKQLRDGLDAAFRDHVAFYGDVPIGESDDVLYLSTVERQPPISENIILEACAWVEIDEDVAGEIISRISTRPKFATQRLTKGKPKVDDEEQDA